ncbi:MAG: trypsin-like peptidase domain-containing protein [Oscillospiraceae bacterium]|nr:trypsin-like peptidase domain-containing protein [Oscillospiraceae bacterium]
MDTYENEYTPEQENTPKLTKKSPFADSPYETYYISADQEETEQPAAPKPRRKRPLLVALVIVLCCAATAVGVSCIWQNQMTKMEQAMSEKFAALEQLYKENQAQSAPSQQLPSQGPMTPGQVYAKNVNAVVAVKSYVQSNGSYGEGVGSGFVISADGYVVTNYHVIEKATQVEVIPHGGETMKAKVVGADSSNDVALLKVEGENMPYVTLGSSDKLLVGDQVAAIGTPLGELTATLTVGYVSAKDRIVNTDGTVINMLQTDAAINAGNSGGPLFNMNGEVIGITTAKYSGNTNSGATIEGLGFAIPMDDVVGILTDLKTYGYVTGAYLGVYVRDVDASAQSYGLPAGAYIEEAIDGYCAKAGGIKTGDIIVNLGGYDVDSVTTLTRVLRRFKAGDTVSVTVYRGGKQVYLDVTLDEKPAQTEDTPTQEQEPTQNEDSNGGNYDGWNGFEDWFDFFTPFF